MHLTCPRWGTITVLERLEQDLGVPVTSSSQSTIYGGQGDDTISTTTGAHDDFLQANKGDDSVQAAGAHDTVLGGQGNDTLSGSGVGDYLDGNLGNDVITLAGSHGQAFGEDGDDHLSSAGGFNVLDGGRPQGPPPNIRATPAPTENVGHVPKTCPSVWRRGRDSNPRPRFLREAVFKTAAIDHSATSPAPDRME